MKLFTKLAQRWRGSLTLSLYRPVKTITLFKIVIRYGTPFGIYLILKLIIIYDNIRL